MMIHHKVVCPTSPDHREFEVSAHVAQLWKVDERGELIDVLEDCTDVDHAPDSTDLYTCMVCGAEGEVVRTEDTA